MIRELSPIDRAKHAAARRGAAYVKPGMRVGLGSGTTVAWLISCLAARVRTEGLRFTCVPSSARTADLARAAGLTLVSPNDVSWLDLTIDEADEVDGDLALINGGDGALLRGKILATASDRMVVIADAGKRVERLGACALPIEIVPIGARITRALVHDALDMLGVPAARSDLRLADAQPFVTEQGNLILDLHLGGLDAPGALARGLNQVPGVVETGLFVDICDTLVLGHEDGRVDVTDLCDPRIDIDIDSNGDEDEAAQTGEPAMPDNVFADLDVPAGRA